MATGSSDTAQARRNQLRQAEEPSSWLTIAPSNANPEAKMRALVHRIPRVIMTRRTRTTQAMRMPLRTHSQSKTWLKKAPTTTPAINDQWAQLDRDYVVKYSAVAPYLNIEGTDFFGKNVDLSCYYNHVLFQFDWTSICLKK